MPYKETEIDSIRGRAKVFHIFDESNGLSPELPYAQSPSVNTSFFSQVMLSSPRLQLPSGSYRFPGEQSLSPEELGRYQA